MFFAVVMLCPLCCCLCARLNALAGVPQLKIERVKPQEQVKVVAKQQQQQQQVVTRPVSSDSQQQQPRPKGGQSWT
jgi:hypothetical protein